MNAPPKCVRCKLAASAGIHERPEPFGHKFLAPIPCQDPACLACQDGRPEKCLRRTPRPRPD